MAFKLPKYTELTDEQKKLVGIKLDKNIVVSAAPGTGKTVVAVYRAHELSDAGKKVALLVYKRTLMLYLESTVKSLGIKATVNTWHSWLVEFYKRYFNKTYPKINGENYTYDWPIIQMDFQRWAMRNPNNRYDAIIVDEAQDLPIELIEALTYVSKSVTCLMDPDQSIDTGGCKIEDVAEKLNVRGAYRLYENFRNHEEIFDLSQVYRQGPCDPREPIYEKPHLVKSISYGVPLEKVANIISRRRLPYIGVFVSPKQLRTTYQALASKFPGRVYMYKTATEFRNVDFDNEGIYVLSYNTMKGLEFDEVIVPNFDKIDTFGNKQTDTNLIYVAITRASHYFYGLYQSTEHRDRYIDSMKPFREGKANKSLVRWE